MPFAERSLEVVVDLYQKTACHKAVVNEKVLQSIVKVMYLFISIILFYIINLLKFLFRRYFGMNEKYCYLY